MIIIHYHILNLILYYFTVAIMMLIRTRNNKDNKFTHYRHFPNNTRLLQKRKSDKVTLSMEPKEKNPVYNFMKQESTKKSIVDFIMSTSLRSKQDRRRTQS
jgi:hypothetical protein